MGNVVTKRATVISALLVSASLASPASAAVIAGLFNTGAAATGAGVSTGNAADAHWALTGGVAYNGASNGVYPVGPWIQEDSTSRWLTPTNNASDNVSVGPYFYTLTFDLTGFKSSTASFTARAAADDGGELFLNGISLGTIGSFSDWTTGLTAGSGFLSGLNVLTFRSDNGGGPAGARLEFLSSSISAVPEPATWAMMLMGFGVVGFGIRRRNSTVTTKVRHA